MFVQQTVQKGTSMQLIVAVAATLHCIASSVSAQADGAQASGAQASGAQVNASGSQSTPSAGNTDSTEESPPPASAPLVVNTAGPAPATVPAAAPALAGSPAGIVGGTANTLPPREAVEPVPPKAGQKPVGFAAEIHLGVDKALIAMDEDFIDFNSINGGLFLGGKIRKVIVGMGFEMSRLIYRNSYNTDYSDYSYRNGSMTTLLFKPGVRFDMFQSDDQKVDLFGQVDIGMGTIIYREDDDSTYTADDGEDPKYFILDWDAGLGVRYWAHPQFAISALGGLGGTYYLERYSEEDTQYSDHVMGIFGALQVLGVF
jgi:hypothetical protein